MQNLFLILFLISINKLASLYATKRSLLLNEPYKPLPDLLHDFLPVTDIKLPDYILLLLFFFHILSNEVNNIDYSKLINSLLIRPIFVISTTLPTCVPFIENEDKSYYQLLFVNYHDLMFSGHTIFFIFFSEKYNSYVKYLIKYVCPLSLISSRQHYTIDIFVSYLVYYFFE
jgi:hypothetical protein